MHDNNIIANNSYTHKILYAPITVVMATGNFPFTLDGTVKVHFTIW